MLFTSVPPAFVFTTISPRVNSVTLLFVVDELSIIPHIVCIYVDAMAMHVILNPLTKVFTAV